MYMSNKNHLIWSSDIGDIENWEFPEEEYGEVLSEDQKYERAYELNSEYLDDERLNLNVQLNTPILAIADLGLWYGRRQGYRLIESGNISDILHSDADEVTWFVDRYNVRATACHHDGTNHYLYRGVRPNACIDNLLNRIYNGEEISSKTLNYYTFSLRPFVAKVYGW